MIVMGRGIGDGSTARAVVNANRQVAVAISPAAARLPFGWRHVG
jgi:hypothetical protein